MSASPPTLHLPPSLETTRSLHRRRLLTWAGTGAAALALPAHAQPGGPRLVTVGGALTEIVYLLGAQTQLVGTDTTSLYPPEALKTPKVGYLRALSAEGLLSLRPDAVVTTSEAGPPVVLAQLRQAGVKLQVIPADHDWREVPAKVQAVGRAAGREPQGRELQARLEAEWADTLRQVAAGGARPPRVLFVLAHAATPQAAGEATAADAVVRYAGGTNCLAGFQGYRPLNAEALASAAPDVVLTTTQGLQAQGGADRFWARPELALIPAHRRRALVAMDALELLGFGPRMPQAVRALNAEFRRWMA